MKFIRPSLLKFEFTYKDIYDELHKRVFESKDYVRDIVENLSKTNFGEFDEDFEVYKKENVIRNLANNMDDDSNVNIWSNTTTRLWTCWPKPSLCLTATKASGYLARKSRRD